jgi:hypothetical protein
MVEIGKRSLSILTFSWLRCLYVAKTHAENSAENILIENSELAIY